VIVALAMFAGFAGKHRQCNNSFQPPLGSAGVRLLKRIWLVLGGFVAQNQPDPFL